MRTYILATISSTSLMELTTDGSLVKSKNDGGI